jgi:hypothetical protein
MEKLEEALTLYRTQFQEDRSLVFGLHTLPEKKGVSFPVFGFFFDALCSGGAMMTCDHSTTIEYEFERDLIGTYRVLHDPVYHIRPLDISLYEVTCPFRDGYLVDIRSCPIVPVQVPVTGPPTSILVSTRIIETWEFTIGSVQYVMRKSAAGASKEDIPDIAPRFDIDMITLDVYNLLDLFGRFDDYGHAEHLPVVILNSKKVMIV